MSSFEINHERMLKQIRADLDAAESFDRNIQNAAEHFASTLSFDDGRAFAETIRYNQHHRRVYLERAAAVLELAGLFDHEEESLDLPTLRNRAARLSHLGKKSVLAEHKRQDALSALDLLENTIGSSEEQIQERFGISREEGLHNTIKVLRNLIERF